MTQPPTPPLRQRKLDVTRQVILEAAAAIVIEQGVQGFSIQNVADRAGVSHRTVYRYFATRQELLDFLDLWVEELRTERQIDMPQRGEEFPAYVSALFKWFEAPSSIFLAASMLQLGGGAISSSRARRTEQARRVFDAELPNLPADERRRSFAVLRYLISVHTWQILRTQYGLTGEQSGPAVARVVAWMIDDLVRRNRAARPEAQPAAPADLSQP